MAAATGRRTSRQQSGDSAERLVADLLAARGWRILGRNVHAGRSELDIVAVDPGPPGRLVVVEVRCRSGRGFGGGEASFDHRKQALLRRGIARLADLRSIASGTRLPRLPIAVDLAVVEPGREGGRAVRLYRNALL